MKENLKHIAAVCAHICVLPLVGLYTLSRHLHEDERKAFRPFSECLSLLPGLSGQYLRRAFYQQTLHSCAADCYIGFGTLLASPRCSIGARVYIGAQCSLGEVEIAEDSMLASGVRVVSGLQQHGSDDLEKPMREQEGVFTPLHIGKNCWIGEGALLASSVGAHSIVAAGAMVRELFPEYSVIAGNPAKVVKSRK